MPGLVSVVIEEQGNLLQSLSKIEGFEEIATPRFEGAMQRAVAMGKSKVIADLRSAADANRSAMISILGEDMQALAPVNPKVPQVRINSVVQNQGIMNIIGIVGDVNKKYLRLTQAGRGPGKHPPARALQDWAESVLGVTPTPTRMTKTGKEIRDLSAGRALSKAIAKHGVKGTPVIDQAGEAIERHVMELFDAELLKIAAELGFK